MKPRLLLIHHSGLLGGAGVGLLDLWKHLQSRYEVVVYVPAKPDDLACYLIRHGCVPQTFPGRLGKIPYYSGGEGLLSARLWYYLLLALLQGPGWRRRIDDIDPDIVIVNSGVLAWMSVILGDVVSLCYVRETLKGSRTSLPNRFLRGLRARFDAVCYLSLFDQGQDALTSIVTLTVRDIVGAEHLPEDIGKVAACRRLGVSSEPFNVLFLGGSSSLKGSEVALDAMRQLTDCNIQLLVAGYWGSSGTSTSRLQRAWRRLSQPLPRPTGTPMDETRVRLLGYLETPALAYSACDVVVFPMLEPHQARPAFEAGAYARPIVISDFPQIGECVTHGRNGMVFPVGDARALARTLRRLSESPQESTRLGRLNAEHTFKYHLAPAAFSELDAFLSQQSGSGTVP